MKSRGACCCVMGGGGRGGLVVLIEDADRVVVDRRMMDWDAGMHRGAERGGQMAQAAREDSGGQPLSR